MGFRPAIATVLLFIGASVTTVAQAPTPSNNVRFVSTSGNDGNDGANWATAKATVQAAVAALAGSPGTVFIAPGTYTFSGTGDEEILITNSVNLICMGWGTLLNMAAGVPRTTDFIHIKPSSVITGVRIQDCTINALGGSGAYGIHFDTSAQPNGGQSLFVVEHVKFGGQTSKQSIFLDNPNLTDGLYDAQIEHSVVTNGILCRRCGDSLTVAEDLIYGNYTGIDADFVPGSSTLRILNNTITPVGGAAIHFGGGTLYPKIIGNEFETETASVRGSNGAYVDIDGTAASRVQFAEITGNSFQIVNRSALSGLRINYADHAYVDRNVFERGASPAVDIAITVNAAGTRIGWNETGKDGWAQIVMDQGSNTLTWVNQGAPTQPIVYQSTDGSTNLTGYKNRMALFSVDGANYLYDGTGSANSNIALATQPAGVGLKRLYANRGTALASRDFSLSGWGNAPVTAPAGSDGAFSLAITAGLSPSANPTARLSFHDGSWTTTPVCSATRTDGNLPTGNIWEISSQAPTALTLLFRGIPVASKAYAVNVVCIGK